MNVKFAVAVAKDSDGNVSVLAADADADKVLKVYKDYTGGKAYFGRLSVDRSKNVPATAKPKAAAKKAARKHAK